jgi:hypothetical protein
VDIEDRKPPLDVQVILWEKNGFVQAPRWLFVAEFNKCSEQDVTSWVVLQLLCPVCRELNRKEPSPVLLGSSLLKDFSTTSLQEVRVVLKPELIREAVRGIETAHYKYWAGQCIECKVIYWYLRKLQPRPITLPKDL